MILATLRDRGLAAATPRRRSGVSWVRLVFAIALLAGACEARAGDDPLVELLRAKGVLTAAEARRLGPADNRADLIDLLQRKGVISPSEAATLGYPGTEAATTAVAAPPAATMTAVAPPPTAPLTAGSVAVSASPQVGYEDGFFVRSTDGKLSLRWNGRAVTNVVADEPDTAVRDGFTQNRARLSFDAAFHDYLRGRVEAEFASSSVLRDAYLALRLFPAFNLQIGQFTVPFGYELQVSSLRTDFVERSVVTTQTVSSRRDIGVMVSGQLAGRILQYQIAMMNGSGQNRADNNADKDFVARLVVSPFASSNVAHAKGLMLGGSFSFGNQPLETTRDANGVVTPSATSIFGADETGFTFYPALPRRGDRMRAGAHAAWFDGPVSVSGEYVHTNEERNGLGAGGADLDELETDGGYVGATWLVTGETRAYNARVRPSRPFRIGEQPGWGALELAVRYEIFEIGHAADPGATTLPRNRYDAALVGLNWYPNDFLRLSLDYLHAVYDKQGAGSADPAEGSNDALLGRAQVDF